MDQEPLITRLKGGEPGAVEELADSFGNRLLRGAFLLCGNETEAEDLVQETFLQAMRSVQRFQGRSSAYTWLYAILLNLTRRHLRERKRIVYDDQWAEREICPADEVPSRQDARTASAALMKALGQLSGAHREVIVLRYFEEMKIHEIARQLGISNGTVKSRLHYAVADLRRILPDELNLFCARGTEGIQKR
jgi:RNA polymerase sigma-70 factor (ECF subfamily)